MKTIRVIYWTKRKTPPSQIKDIGDIAAKHGICYFILLGKGTGPDGKQAHAEMAIAG